jgi:hypothetical protein
MIRNRIHSVIDRHAQLKRPVVKDLFSNQGKAWMKRAALPVADRTLLDEDLALHTFLQTQIDALEAIIVAEDALGRHGFGGLQFRTIKNIDFVRRGIRAHFRRRDHDGRMLIAILFIDARLDDIPLAERHADSPVRAPLISARSWVESLKKPAGR